MYELITDVEQVTPDRLTRVLHKKGYLTLGNVTVVRKNSSSITPCCIVYHLELSYSDDTPKSAPSRLLLKIPKPDLELSIGKREVDFYNSIATTVIEPPLVRCYEALYSPERRKFHLLLDDLSETHFQLQWPLPPSKLQCEQVIDSLAKFHAYWWEHPRLGKDIGEVFNEESLWDCIRETEKRVAYFMDFLGDRLSVERRKLYKKVLSSLPKLWKRLSDVKGLTIIHGDAHVWNFLYPRDPNKDKVRIIDWDAWTIGLGPSDLSYMIALHWYPERRHSMEQNLVRWYHDGLLQHGIEDYDWDDCWLDYRKSAITNILIPVWQWSAKLRPSIWWPNLERSILAFHDLECAELLENEVG